MADADVIRLDSKKMNETIQIIENQLNIIMNCYDNIKHDATVLLGSHWDAASAKSFISTINVICSDEQIPGKVSAGAVLSVLRAYIHDLKMVIEKSSQTEISLTNMIDSLPTNAFNV